MNVKKVNAFTDSFIGGNPAGVVLNPEAMTDKQMKHIAKTLAVSEAAFIFPSKVADYKIRFFSPEVEVDLCGHATIATFFTMAQEGYFDEKPECTVTQETKAGILPVTIYFKENVCEKVMMTQGKTVLKGIRLNKDELSKALNTKSDQIDDSLPAQIVSTGLFTLPVCVQSFRALKIMKPDFHLIKNLCTKLGVGSIHVFTFDTIEESSTYHARVFAPLYGINEDPVTGTANGAVSSYLRKNGIIKEDSLICEQGDIIGRPGRVYVELHNGIVKVGGRAVLVEEKEIKVE